MIAFMDDLNGLNNYEYTELISSLKYVYQERYNCHDPAKYQKKKGTRYLTQEDVNTIRFVNNCFRVTKLKEEADLTHDTLEFYTCPCNFYNPEIETLIHCAQYYSKNFILPEYIYNNKEDLFVRSIQIIHIINNFINEHEAKLMEKRREEAERKIKAQSGKNK